jgi:hypothetical protein
MNRIATGSRGRRAGRRFAARPFAVPVFWPDPWPFFFF